MKILTLDDQSPRIEWRSLVRADANAGPNLLADNLLKREIPSLFGLRGIAALVVVESPVGKRTDSARVDAVSVAKRHNSCPTANQSERFPPAAVGRFGS